MSFGNKKINNDSLPNPTSLQYFDFKRRNRFFKSSHIWIKRSIILRKMQGLPYIYIITLMITVKDYVLFGSGQYITDI